MNQADNCVEDRTVKTEQTNPYNQYEDAAHE